MRTGKTLTALETCKKKDYKSVLFFTKKKAIASVLSDYKQMGYSFDLTVTNYEQAVNISKIGWDVVICDEAHCLKAYPKPSGRTQTVKDILFGSRADLILLSGTPTPESYSDIYHQFWVSPYSPFTHANFYKWAKEFVDVKQVMINGRLHNDYKKAIEHKIKPIVNKYFITYTREEAEVKIANVSEEVKYIDCDSRLNDLMKILIRDKYYIFKDGTEIVCDTAVKLKNKLHQISSGTIITETGESKILDRSKAEYIKQNYQHQRVAIFYKFKAEGDALREVISNSTDSPEEFATTDKAFICQVQSGSMGVDLSSADVLVFYNIDFSAVQYWQARDRLLKHSRDSVARVDWIFNKDGIESKVWQAVQNKQDYTLNWFKRDYKIINNKEVA
jgi:SNF2 family DNA or RNA helicase